MPKSNVAIFCALALIVGIGVSTSARESDQILTAIVGGLFILCCLGMVLSKRRPWRIACLIGIFFVAGMARVMIVPTNDDNPFDQEISFTAEVAREPAILIDHQRVVVKQIRLADQQRNHEGQIKQRVQGDIQIKIPLQPRLMIGDQLEVACLLRRPEPVENFRYDRYLERYHIAALCYYPSFYKIGSRDSLPRQFFLFKQRVIESIQRVMAPPEHTILLGTLLGINKAIPDYVNDYFRATGTSHILVISGMHVVLMTSFLFSFLKIFRLSRRRRILVLIGILVVYVLFTGVQAAAVRAAVSGSIVLFAELFGRQGSALRLLVFTAAGMLLVNPLLLIADIGFQLSFAATIGIIVFTPWLQSRLEWLGDILHLPELIATSVAAIISTAPIIIYQFHTFSLIALVVNIIVVPMMTIVMIVGSGVMILALFLPTLTSWLALPLYFLIHLMIAIVKWFAAWPYATIEIAGFNTTLFVLTSLGIVAMGYYGYRWRWRENERHKLKTR